MGQFLSAGDRRSQVWQADSPIDPESGAAEGGVAAKLPPDGRTCALFFCAAQGQWPERRNRGTRTPVQ
jgi:hypothetical protein